MNYTNATDILPDRLLKEIQEYIQGEYLYIPVKDKGINSTPTEYKLELLKRDEKIYTKYLGGINKKKLSRKYNLSESSIRRIIIQQRKKSETMEYRIVNILEKWNLQDSETLQIYDSAWQIGKDFVLKVYNDFQMLQRNIKIVMALDKRNIPVGNVIKTKENMLYAEDSIYYYVLTKKLQGNNITDINENQNMAYKMGHILADLHLAFKECELQDEFWKNSLLDEMNGWIRETFIQSKWKYIEETKFEETVRKLNMLYDSLPIQLIHRDVHFGNFLFDHGEFSGYIDFDLSQRNIRIFDLCYFMLGLLSEEEKLEILEEQWFMMLEKFLDGYGQQNKLTDEEKQAIPCVMESIELLFAAWFIGQNDMKCAEDAIRIYEFVNCRTDRILKCVQ